MSFEEAKMGNSLGGIVTGRPQDELVGLALEEYEKVAKSIPVNDPRRVFVLGFCRAAELMIRGQRVDVPEGNQLTNRGMLPPSFFATPTEPE